MQCPYCVSQISDQALACPHCTRDLYLFKPLLDGKAALEKALAAQQEQMAKLEARLAELEQRPQAAMESAAVAIVEQAEEEAPPSVATRLGACLAMFAVPLVLLLLTHWVLLFIYDVRPLYLRIATLVLPIPFGMVLARRYADMLGWSALTGLLLGLLSVFGMLTVTALIDNVPLLPQNARDWRETFEYVTGIGLAFFTGSLIGHAGHAAQALRHRQPPKVIVLVARAFKTNERGEMAVEALAKRIHKLVNTATPAVAGAASFYAGIRGVLGDG